MTTDRQLWGLGGLSAVATLIVLLGASGAGADISRAAAAALGAGGSAPATASATPASSTEAASDDAAEETTATDDTAASSATETTAVSDATDTAATDDTATDTSDTPTATTSEEARKPSNIKQVFVVTLAGKGVDATFGSSSPATYLATDLRPKGVLLSGFTSLGSSGLADRIALVSGQPPNPSTAAGCPRFTLIPPLTAPDKAGLITKDGCVYPNTIQTLAEQFAGRRLTWKAYAEDLDRGPKGAAATCRRPDYDQPDDTLEPRPGDTYTARNVPWVYFRGLIDVASCDSGVVPLSKLGSDIGTLSSTPNVAYIAPDCAATAVAEPAQTASPAGWPPPMRSCDASCPRSWPRRPTSRARC